MLNYEREYQHQKPDFKTYSLVIREQKEKCSAISANQHS